jgi:monoamine oxidase
MRFSSTHLSASVSLAYVRREFPPSRLESGRAGHNNLHICGEAYSGYQGFIEGALQSAEDVINVIRD